MDTSFAARRPVVAITFDDAYRSVYEEALPVLERYGFSATVFVPTRFIGDRNRWDAPYRPPLEIMSRHELQDGGTRGLALESHGHGHVNLASATFEEARDDLGRSVEILTDLRGTAPKFLAFPFSEGSLPAQRAAAELGFVAAFNIGGVDAGRFSLGRVPIGQLDPPWIFPLQTSGRFLKLRHAPITEALLKVRRRVRKRRSVARPPTT
jgi:peptidoglycan/xylan/chitin deacetylase (PgdA/CDA1 family)